MSHAVWVYIHEYVKPCTSVWSNIDWLQKWNLIILVLPVIFTWKPWFCMQRRSTVPHIHTPSRPSVPPYNLPDAVNHWLLWQQQGEFFSILAKGMHGAARVSCDHGWWEMDLNQARPIAVVWEAGGSCDWSRQVTLMSRDAFTEQLGTQQFDKIKRHMQKTHRPSQLLIAPIEKRRHNAQAVSTLVLFWYISDQYYLVYNQAVKTCVFFIIFKFKSYHKGTPRWFI